MIKKRTHIVIEVHDDFTDLHVGPFMHDRVTGDNHEQRGRELIALMLNEMDFYLKDERERILKARQEQKKSLKQSKQSKPFLELVK